MAALAIPIEVQEQSLSQSTVILQVKFGLLGDSRKVSASQVEVDTDKQLLRVAKKILVSAEFEAIRQLNRKVKKYLDSVCVPFETGTRFLAVPLIEDVDRRLREFERERADLVDRFLDSYPTLCESMSDRLRVLHNPTDYPPIDMVKARFYFTWRYVASACRDSSRQSRVESGRRSGKKPRNASPKRRPRRKVYYGSRCRNSSITWSSGWKPLRMENRRSSRSPRWRTLAISWRRLTSAISPMTPS